MIINKQKTKIMLHLYMRVANIDIDTLKMRSPQERAWAGHEQKGREEENNSYLL